MTFEGILGIQNSEVPLKMPAAVIAGKISDAMGGLLSQYTWGLKPQNTNIIEKKYSEHLVSDGNS